MACELRTVDWNQQKQEHSVSVGKTHERWLGLGLCNRNVPFHWAREISEIQTEFLLNGKRPSSVFIPYSANVVHVMSSKRRTVSFKFHSFSCIFKQN